MPLVIVLYALFGLVFILCKMGLEHAQPLFFVGSRMILGGGVILAIHGSQGGSFLLNKGALLRVILLAVFNIYLCNACELWGLQYLSPAKTCFIYSLSPFASALLSFFLFSETLSGKKWLGLIIGFSAFIPIIFETAIFGGSTDPFFTFSLPELAVSVAAFSGVYGWILLKQLVTQYNTPVMLANGLSMLLGGSFAMLHSRLTEGWSPIPVTDFVPFLTFALLTLLISNLVCYNLYAFLLRRYTATFMSFAGFMTPLFTAFFTWIFFGETAPLHFYALMGVAFIGLLLFKQEELQSETSPFAHPLNRKGKSGAGREAVDVN